MTLFARSKRFAWSESERIYRRSDQHTIKPAEGPFQWAWFDDRKNLVRRLWVAEQRLDKGVEIDTQVWESIKTKPQITAVVVIGDDGSPRSIAGETLIKMVAEKLVVVYPFTYRLRSAQR
jgi:hypothetical protein